MRIEEPLSGGQHAQTFAAHVGSQPCVLRVFPADDDAVVRELRVLRLLAPLAGVVPEPLGSGTFEGRQFIITTRLPGVAPSRSLDPLIIAGEMARALARIHAIQPTGLQAIDLAPHSGATPVARLATTSWPRVQGDPVVLCHNDYWSGNAVWSGGQLTGVVDWSGAGAASTGRDLAWCRQDLVLLGSPEAAREFLTEYERAAGVTVADIAAWDALAAWSAEPRVETWAPNYAGVGRANIDGPTLRARLTAWSETLLRAS